MRREHQLQPRTREGGGLRQRTGNELCLPTGSQLGLDAQRTAAVLDEAIAPAKYVGLQRSQLGDAVSLEDKRLGLVEPLDVGLTEISAESPPHEPLELARPRRAAVERPCQPSMHVVGSDTEPLELSDGQVRPAAEAERARGVRAPLANAPGPKIG